VIVASLFKRLRMRAWRFFGACVDFVPESPRRAVLRCLVWTVGRVIRTFGLEKHLLRGPFDRAAVAIQRRLQLQTPWPFPADVPAIKTALAAHGHGGMLLTVHLNSNGFALYRLACEGVPLSYVGMRIHADMDRLARLGIAHIEPDQHIYRAIRRHVAAGRWVYFTQDMWQPFPKATLLELPSALPDFLQDKTLYLQHGAIDAAQRHSWPTFCLLTRFTANGGYALALEPLRGENADARFRELVQAHLMALHAK
jgi:hypothetical protein